MLGIQVKTLLQFLFLASVMIGGSVMACLPGEEPVDFSGIVKFEDDSTNLAQSKKAVQQSISSTHQQLSVLSDASQHTDNHNCECCDVCTCANCVGCTGCTASAIPALFAAHVDDFQLSEKKPQYQDNFISLPPIPLEHRPK